MATQDRLRHVRDYLTMPLPSWVAASLEAAAAAVLGGMAGFVLCLLASLVLGYQRPVSIGGAIVCAGLAVWRRKHFLAAFSWMSGLFDMVIFLVRLPLAVLRIF